MLIGGQFDDLLSDHLLGRRSARRTRHWLEQASLPSTGGLIFGSKFERDSNRPLIR